MLNFIFRLYRKSIKVCRSFFHRVNKRTNLKSNFSIIVFQMGKVGSKTIQESLINAYADIGIQTDIHHSHILCGFEQSELIIRKERLNPEPSLGAISNGRVLRKLIDENPNYQWKIISLVRDPVARNVATFFDNLHEFVPNWYTYKQDDPALMQIVQKAFISEQTIHTEPYRWFDEQMLPVFGIDVFSEPFPKEKGYKIYNPDSITPVLIIRLEDLNRIAHVAVKEFLGLDHFQISNANTAKEKPYAQIYSLFKEQPLSSEYINAIYNSKYAQLFYSEEEIRNFRQSWQ